MVKMFFCSMWEDNYVLKIDETIYEIQLSQAILHQLLESGWGIAHPKGHEIAFKKA